MRLPLSLFVGLGLAACSTEPTPSSSYRVVGTAVTYSNFHNLADPAAECITSRGPKLRTASIGVREKSNGAYIVSELGCDFDADLEGGVLRARNAICRLDAEGTLALLGVRERLYEHFSLNLETGELSYAYRQLMNASSSETNSCFVFDGTGTPEAAQ